MASKLVEDYKTCRKAGMSHFRAIQQTAATNGVASRTVRAALAESAPFTAADYR